MGVKSSDRLIDETAMVVVRIGGSDDSVDRNRIGAVRIRIKKYAKRQ